MQSPNCGNLFIICTNYQEMGQEKVRMASLLHKFRIEFASVEIVVGLDGDPSPERYILGTLDTVINVYLSFIYSMFNVLHFQFIKTI